MPLLVKALPNPFLRKGILIHRHPKLSQKCYQQQPHRSKSSIPNYNSTASQRLWQSYNRSLKSQPLLTKCSTAAFIFFSSDVVAQNVTTSDGALSIDLHRALSGATFGIIGSCWLHFWWNALEKVVEARVPVARHRLGNTLVKVFLDQSVGAPLYIYCYFFLTNAIQGSKEKDNALTKRAHNAHAVASDALWPTMLKHWRLWPFVHTLNFYYVPLQHRVILQNIVLAGWSGYLSHINNSSAERVNYENGARLQRQKSVIGLDVVDTRENGAGRGVIVRQTKNAAVSSSVPITKS